MRSGSPRGDRLSVTTDNFHFTLKLPPCLTCLAQAQFYGLFTRGEKYKEGANQMALGVTDSARSPVTFEGPRARTLLVVHRHRSKYFNILMAWWHRPVSPES